MGVCGKELLWASILMIGSMMYGYTMGYPSPALLGISQEMNVSQSAATFFNAVPSLTAVAGPFICEAILKSTSYRTSVVIIGIIGCGIWTGLIFMVKYDIWLGVVGRAIIGFVLGSTSSLIPLYINDLAPKEYLGIFGSLNQLGITIGFTLCYFISTWITWVHLAIVGAGMFFLLVVFVWIVPNRKASDDQLLKESLWQRHYIKKLLIGIATMFFQQFCGINAIVTNLDSLFLEVGIHIPSGIASAVSNLAQVITAIVGSIMIQKWGKQIVWIISMTGCCVFLVFYALCVHFEHWPREFCIMAIFLFLLLFGCGAGPIPWFIIPQMFPASVRSTAVSVGTAISWVFVFTVIMTFPYIRETIGEVCTMLTFAVISLVGAMYGYFMITDDEDPDSHVLTYDSMPTMQEEMIIKE